MLQYSKIDVKRIVYHIPKTMQCNVNRDVFFIPLYYKSSTGAAEKLVVKTPTLPLPFNVIKNDSGSYAYSVSLSKHDVDDNVKKFMTFIDKCDDYCSSITSEIVKRLKRLKVKITNKVHYNDSVNEYDQLPLKLIRSKNAINNGDNNQSILTRIYRLKDRTVGSVTDIKYGCHADQIIQLAGLTYVPQRRTFYPYWNVHQIVLHDTDPIFSSVCLLDMVSQPEITSGSTNTAHPVVTSIPNPLAAKTRLLAEIKQSRASALRKAVTNDNASNSDPPKPQPASRLIISKDMLLSMKNKLRKSSD